MRSFKFILDEEQMQDSTGWMSVNEMLKSVKTAVFDEHKPADKSDSVVNMESPRGEFVLTKEMLIQNIQPMLIGEKEFAIASARILKKFARVFALNSRHKTSIKRVMAKDGS